MSSSRMILGFRREYLAYKILYKRHGSISKPWVGT
jgi:hypothetical protein